MGREELGRAGGEIRSGRAREVKREREREVGWDIGNRMGEE